MKWVNEYINGAGAVDNYLRRWGFTCKSGRSLYFHVFTGDDWAEDLHDHPKWFLSIGLWGDYWEWAKARPLKRYRAPWIRWFPATHAHRTETRLAVTVCLTGKTTRAWGFWRGGVWIPASEYVSRYGGKVV